MQNNADRSPGETLERLAKERTLLANERNTLAHIRTGLSVFVVGIGLIKLFDASPAFVIGGWISIVAGLIFIVAGVCLYPVRKKKIMAK